MILDEYGLYFWNMDTGEKRWQMEEGFNPRWWLRDGQYVDLGDLAFLRSQLVPTSGGVRVDLCSQSLTSCSPSTGTYWLLWLYGGFYSSVSELGSTVDTCSATLGF